jgi:type I restriction enzyme, S subunit
MNKWHKTLLKDIADIKYGKANPKTKGLIPVIGSGGIYGFTKNALVDFPTIVVGRKGSAGTSWLVQNPSWPSDTTYYLDWKSDDIDHNFVYWQLQMKPLSGQHAKTTLPSLQKSDLEQYELVMPPKSVQNSISTTLQKAQLAIELTEKVITATRQLKQSLLHHLFTYGPVPVDEAENVELQETEIGLIPKHWQLVRLGEIADVRGGKRLPKGKSFADSPTHFPYIRVVDFANSTVATADLKYVTPEIQEKIERYTINTSDVYISIAGSTGIVGVVPDELNGANLTENAARIIIQDQHQLNRDFLMYFLGSSRGQHAIDIRTTKTSQPKLALARIKDLPIPLPPQDEQQQVVHALRAVADKETSESNKANSLTSLFDSLLDHLMTGKVKVNHDKINA